MLPERISNDLCSLRRRRGSRRARGAHGRSAPTGASAATLSPRADALGREAALRAGAGRHRRLAGRDHRAAAGARCWSRSRPPTARSSAPATSASRSISICPSARSCSTANGTVDRVVTPRAARCPPADRGVHDPRQRGGGRDAGAGARAADLSRPRRAEPGEESMRCASSCRPSTSRCRRAARCAPAQFNRILRAGRKAATSRSWSTRWCCARQAQAEYAAENYGHFGLNLRRYAHFTSPIRRYADLVVHRALIRALKLGGDGLPEQRTWQRSARSSAHDLRRRAPRHEGGARDLRPADRAFPRRPHRRDVRGPHFGRHPRRPVRQAGRYRRRRLHPGRARSATSISAITRTGTRWSATAAARATGSATA